MRQQSSPSAGASAIALESAPYGEPPYELIRDGLAKGRVIPFLGAGVSLGSRVNGQSWTSPRSDFLPSAAELANYLDRRSGFPSGEPPELTRVAQYFGLFAGLNAVPKAHE